MFNFKTGNQLTYTGNGASFVVNINWNLESCRWEFVVVQFIFIIDNIFPVRLGVRRVFEIILSSKWGTESPENNVYYEDNFKWIFFG